MKVQIFFEVDALSSVRWQTLIKLLKSFVLIVSFTMIFLSRIISVTFHGGVKFNLTNTPWLC